MRYNVRPRLLEVLKEKNMTQKELSELTGINQGTISRFDRSNQRKDQHMVTIANALNVPIEQLFEITKIDEESHEEK